MNQSLQKFAETLIEMYGGSRAVEDAIAQSQNDFQEVWEQDHGEIGRIVRAHVAVEYFLSRRLALDNPQLGNLERARLSFMQMVALLDTSRPEFEMLKSGLRLLNSIRNRAAHRPRSGVTTEDRDKFLAIEIFSALRTELAQRVEPPIGPLTPSLDPIDVLEDFGRFTAQMLQPLPDEKKWKAAIQTAISEAGLL